MLYMTKNHHGGDVYGRSMALDFSANVNPLGTPQSVLDAVRDALPQMHRYPDPYCRELVQAIARHENVPPAFILCGSGAAELIYAYCQAVRPRRAVEPAPTFSEYSLALGQTGCTVTRWPLRQENQFDLGHDFTDFVRRTHPDVVFLCTPNNPTGRLVPPQVLSELAELCRRQGIRLFVDECFLDLTEHGRSLTGLLAEIPGLFILKAFTKSYGMAGVRLGYGLSADAGLLHSMSQAVQPWNVSSLAQAAGVAALRDQAFLQRTRQAIAAERPWLTAALRGLGFQVCDSHANYLLFHGPQGLHTALLDRGIAIRSCCDYYGLGPGWYRVAVRLHEENEALAAALAGAVGRK